MRTFPNHSSHTSPMCLSEVQVLHSRVISDISTRGMICCCVLNIKFLLRVHQFHTFVVKQIHYSGPNIINVVLIRVTIIFCWSCFSMRRSPTYRMPDSQMLLTTIIHNYLLCYGSYVIITATYWTFVEVITKCHITISGHDVRYWLMLLLTKFWWCKYQCRLMQISSEYCEISIQGVRWCCYQEKIV